MKKLVSLLLVLLVALTVASPSFAVWDSDGGGVGGNSTEPPVIETTEGN